MKKAVIAMLCLFLTKATAQRSPEEQVQSLMETHQNQAKDFNNEKGFEEAGNLVSVNKSGDAQVSIPVIMVKGRKLKLPVNLNYQAGIKVDQKASSAGLGWDISFGSIVRDYGAFEPDYSETSGEVDMINPLTNKASDLTSPSTSGLYGTFHRNKNLAYDGVTGHTPDVYHLSIPGQEGNTFWNAGTTSHQFILEKYRPWQISHTSKVYTISQEISRINEINAPNMSNSQVQKSFAAAICIPPYVADRAQHRLVIDANGNNMMGNVSGEREVTYRDFEKFIITAEDGTQYIFGRALRGQKYLLNEEPFWSTIQGGPGNLTTITDAGDFVLGEFWKIDFIAEWLLTEVRSSDYQDANSNGIADDGDLGDWIRITYTDAVQSEYIWNGSGAYMNVDVPKHREWMNFSRTDRTSSIMRERAYVTEIITPTEKYEFEISERFDVDHDYFTTPLNTLNGAYYYSNHTIGTNGPSYMIRYPVEVMRYDQITQKDRVNDQPVQTIKFKYAQKGSAQELAVSEYLILNNNKQENNLSNYDPDTRLEPGDLTNYNTGDKRGKTTLLALEFYPEDNLTSNQYRSYEFGYANNPSFSFNHLHDIIISHNFPSLRASYALPRPLTTDIPTQLPFRVNSMFSTNLSGINQTYGSTMVDELGHYSTEATNATFNKDAWSLTKITLPLGGSIELQYESDESEMIDYHWENSWSNGNGRELVNDMIPTVQNYNRVALTKFNLQSRINDNANYYSKKLTGTFSMPLSNTSGGIRLKKKIINDGNGTISHINYTYGPGTFSGLPRSYLENYISAFSSFMQHQRSKQESSFPYYTPVLSTTKIYENYGEGVRLVYDGGPVVNNDFDTYVYRLMTNIRLDHTVKDDTHFYEYIQEQYNNGAKLKRIYKQVYENAQNPSMTLPNPVLQKEVYLKGFSFYQGDVVELITNDADPSREVVLKEEQYFPNGSSTPARVKKWDFSIDMVDSRSNDFSAATINSGDQRVYVYQSSDSKLIYLTTSNELDMGTHYPLADMFDGSISNYSTDILDFLDNVPIPGQIPSRITDNDYYIPAVSGHTRYVSYHLRLDEEEVIEYGTDGSGPISKVTKYFYDNLYRAEPSRTYVSRSDAAGTYTTMHQLYPDDYTNTTGFIGDMKNANILNRPIETISGIYDENTNNWTFSEGYSYVYKTGTQAGLLDRVYRLQNEPLTYSGFRFSNRGSQGLSNIPPAGTNSLYSRDSHYNSSPDINYTYDDYGNPVEVQRENEAPVSYVWGYKDALPVASAQGVARDKFRCESFEEGVNHTGDSYTGEQCRLQPPGNPVWSPAMILLTPDQGKKYLFSGWVKTESNFVLNKGEFHIWLIRYPGTSSEQELYVNSARKYINDTEGKWKQFISEIDIATAKSEFSIPAGEAVGIKAIAVNRDTEHYFLLDECRLHPNDALITTYTHKPLTGVSSSADPRGQVETYEYDEFGRRQLTKDAEGNILEKQNYHYRP